MGRRKDQPSWTTEQDDFLRDRLALGLPVRVIHAQWPQGFPYRTRTALTLRKQKLGLKTAVTPDGMQRGVQQPPPPEEVGTWAVQDDGAEIVVRSFGTEVKTLDELIARARIDTTKYEVDRPETSMHETTVRDTDGKIRKVQNFRLVARFRLRQGPTTLEQVEAILAGAFAQRKPLALPRPKQGNAQVLQGVIVNDVHVGKLAWERSTGGPSYDTGLSVSTLRDGVTHLMHEGDARDIGLRHFWLLGDYFHHDGQGTTTSGTVMDYDSRVQKMLRDGTEVLCDLIAASAERVPTVVYLVPGNHDRTLTWALQRILLAEFKRHKGVTIDEGYTSTKYLRHGKCLIGLDHGDKGKKRLAASMAHACAVEWGQTTVRDIHTGHLHTKRRAATEADTIEGVTVYTHNALCPADQYHADEKFDTSPRTIEAFRYHAGGMCAGTDAWSPDLHAAPRSGLTVTRRAA
jgi:hypothetical protein